MTDQEITIRIIQQELNNMLDHNDCGLYPDNEVMDTIIDRIVDLTNFIRSQTPLPNVYAVPWQPESE